MQLMTTRFGMVEVDDDKLLLFANGLPGFEGLRRFALLPVAGNPVWQWLQAVEEPGIAFLITDPFVFFPSYAVELAPEQEVGLELADPGEAVIYVVVTVPSQGVREMTANLVAPVVINLQQHQAAQLIMAGTPYTTRHKLLDFQERSSKAAAGAE